jgi:hypothetical protein
MSVPVGEVAAVAASRSTAPAAAGVAPPRRPLTTPRRLRIAAAALGIGLLVFGVVGALGAAVRYDAARSVDSDAAPLLVGAENTYTALSDADAAASTAFLSGLESRALRDRYLRDLDTASRQLVDVAHRRGLSDDGSAALTTIARDLPVYAGLVEKARANNRQGYPVGAAYLGRASLLMRNEVLPAASALYENAADRLDARYRSGTSRVYVVLLVLVGIVILALLLGIQLYLASKVRRVFNVGLVAATVLVVMLGAVSAVTFTRAQDALLRSERDGSVPLQVLSTGRILALRSLSDDNLDLIQRGTDTSYVDDFAQTRTRLVAAKSGFMALATRAETRAGDRDRAVVLRRQLDAYLAQHDVVRGFDKRGDYNRAVVTALGDEATALGHADVTFRSGIDVADRHLESQASHSSQLIRSAAVAILLLSLLAAAVAVLGIRRRIGEYV